MSVDPALAAMPSTLATSTTGNPGDNQLAMAIAGIRDEVLIDGQPIGTAYNNLVVRMGSHSREATTQNEVNAVSLQYLETQRESMAGVSIDEEMINMVKFQQAYNAAARIVSVLDEMIDTVVNRMGTGR
jgi:flagellar hook-associated protein 1 FlgK